MKLYQVYSPDGIEIGHMPYHTLKAARNAFKTWIGRYKAQGYYRDNQWRKIPLSDLADYCTITKLS